MKAQDIAKYYLMRAANDGDLITHLKMQKLIYYAYVWCLVNLDGKKLFDQPIEAWPNGPVVADLYHELKQFGSMPVSDSYVDDAKLLIEKIRNSEFRDTVDEVYDTYMSKSAFELVALTHSEGPWSNARNGKKPTDASNDVISDSEILSFYKK